MGPIRACYHHLFFQGDTAMDTLRHWQKTYSRELDQETKQECAATERLLRKAVAGGGEAFVSLYHFCLGLPSNILLTVLPTYLRLTQWLLLRRQPSLSMLCRTASCLMLRTRSHCCPLEGAVLPAKTGPAPTRARRCSDLLAPNGGRAMAQHTATEREEQRLPCCMG